jgi:galactokinase
MDIIFKVREAFKASYGVSPDLLLKASGRANIIGEHTDYHQGFVLPFAIDKGIAFAASKSEQLNIESMDYNNTLDEYGSYTKGSWQSYANSAMTKLSEVAGKKLGIKMKFSGDLPIGAGVSSSSALCCGIIEVVNKLYKLEINEIDKVNLASEIEHGAGVQGGKMDQYSIFFGQQHGAILMDCRSLTNEIVPIPHGWKFLLINTLVKHNLVNTEYNTRRKEGESGIAIIAENLSKIKTARDLTIEILNEYKSHLSPIQYNRLHHVIKENQRVQEFKVAMLQEDIDTCKFLLNSSHSSLRDLYEVSCKELDFIQTEAQEQNFIYGARIMGGGFGGCTINLIKEIDHQGISTIKVKFKAQYGYEPQVYEVSPSQGIILYE